jgi:nucleoside-diphosphate-sugar epimerase
MRVFIVGANGVIGRHLIPTLLARGDDVTALVRSASRAEAIAGPGVDLIEGDLLQIDEGALTKLLDGCDAAAHLATALRRDSPGLGTTNTNEALRIEGTAKLLRAATRAGVRRYVQQSIAFATVDAGEEWVDESTPLDAAPGRIGNVIEAMESLVRESDLEWLILRGGIFVGPDTFEDDTVARLRAGTERIAGDGSYWVSPVHVADYADAVALALEAPASRVVLNITAEPVRQRDYIERLSAALDVPPAPFDSEARMRQSYRCSNAAALEVLGWQPRRSIWRDGAS